MKNSGMSVNKLVVRHKEYLVNNKSIINLELN